MRVPKNMTEKEVIDQMMVVIDRTAAKYTFYGYDVEDIKQEAFIICMDALERYDEKRPLENFLAVHLSNRLKNFIRDNYYIKDEEDKKKILKPKSLSNEEFLPQVIKNSDDSIDAKHIHSIINKYLPPSYRADYLKIINDVYVPKKRREDIIETIKEIVEGHSNEEG
jgi:RNA polymerase sigma factor (sigma-70 family)